MFLAADSCAAAAEDPAGPGRSALTSHWPPQVLQPRAARRHGVHRQFAVLRNSRRKSYLNVLAQGRFSSASDLYRPLSKCAVSERMDR